MTLLHRFRRWYCAWHFAGQEQARRERERVERDHELIAARLEAVQAEVSRGARIQARVVHSADLIPFPSPRLR